MIGATSLARVARARATRTSPSGVGEYNEGDMVDYYRRDGSKDQSGWHGPVPVARNAPEQGQVILKLNGRDRPCRLQDVRHTLLIYTTYMSGPMTISPNQAERIIDDAIAAMPLGKPTLYGMIKGQADRWTTSKASRLHPQLSQAIEHTISISMDRDDVVAVRIARGAGTLHTVSGYSSSLLVWWMPGNKEHTQVYECTGSYIDCTNLIGEDYTKHHMMQLLTTTDEDVDYGMANDDHHERTLDAAAAAEAPAQPSEESIDSGSVTVPGLEP